MHQALRTTLCAATLLGTLLLTACGGGSDDDGTPVVTRPVISDETARLRRMDAPESAPLPAVDAAASAAAF